MKKWLRVLAWVAISPALIVFYLVVIFWQRWHEREDRRAMMRASGHQPSMIRGNHRPR